MDQSRCLEAKLVEVSKLRKTLGMSMELEASKSAP
ncbi:hypothetical protein C5167_034363 [Papaver somniferum]|uniref:Uncharacterized protein n=1 Tax=Papaver somniferum TaxID=3469 RepID=A0A4Y7KGU8_PAPSO|nr:hypothetical protein C5167_034363 [Papaver somniferum]